MKKECLTRSREDKTRTRKCTRAPQGALSNAKLALRAETDSRLAFAPFAASRETIFLTHLDRTGTV